MGNSVQCDYCRKTCTKNVIEVENKYFHVDCHKCGECCASLAKRDFFIRDQKHYCRYCYEFVFGIKCPVCQKPVLGQVLTAFGQTYHQNCLKCVLCERPFFYSDQFKVIGTQIICFNCAEVMPQFINSSNANDSDENNEVSRSCRAKKIC